MENPDELVKCAYGGHLVKRSDFSPAGLKNFYTYCKDCNRARKKKNREKHREAYNLKQRVKRKRQAEKKSS